MSTKTLFTPYSLSSIELPNRVVMAPLTRCRAIGNVPNALMAEYYEQRASVGLIITEGTSPSPNGLGYARMPGIFSAEQVAGWKGVTDAVHAKGGHIFLQVMHTGRMSHPLNMAADARIVAPSAIAAAGEMYTDQEGPQPQPVPEEMSVADIEATIEEFVQSAKNALAAGFDGIELHGANGYLIEQFLNPSANERTDEYGGSAENRNRFAIEVARRTAAAIGAGKVGIRLSPYGANGDLKPFEGLHEQYVALSRELGQIGLAYIHVVDHSAMGAPEVPWAIKDAIRDAFGGTLILSGGYDAERAEVDLKEGRGHLVAFGRPALANPDLVERLKAGAELNEPDYSTLYTPGPEGYTDYPSAS
ncbi:alkene reductase [Microvenator marinus]|uniref:Alkene reductase n=1 Tax=Microvenator marinus TaxID=2600177 RepID=A0A5B8XRA7_9DELT|nr:alkene reductase [Microvenator marinus]QED28472.1 alkene reductase [Microvenator marinus]